MLWKLCNKQDELLSDPKDGYIFFFEESMEGVVKL